MGHVFMMNKGTPPDISKLDIHIGGGDKGVSYVRTTDDCRHIQVQFPSKITHESIKFLVVTSKDEISNSVVFSTYQKRGTSWSLVNGYDIVSHASSLEGLKVGVIGEGKGGSMNSISLAIPKESSTSDTYFTLFYKYN